MRTSTATAGTAPTIYVDPSGLAEIKATEELWVAERVGYGKIGDEVFYGTRPWGDYFGNMLDMAPWASASPWYGFSRSLNEKYGASLSLTGGRVEANAVGGGHHFADDPVYQATMKNMKTVAMDKVTVYLPKDTLAEKAVQDGLITKDHTKYDSCEEGILVFAYFKKDLAVPETTWSIQNKYLPLEYNNSTGLRLRLQIPLPEGFQFNLKVPLTGSDDKTSSLTNAADQVNSGISRFLLCV